MSLLDVNSHLILHCVDELEICGPISIKWLYHANRIMGHLKRHSKPKGSMVARHAMDCALGSITSYMKDFVHTAMRVWDENEEPIAIGKVLGV